MNFVNFDQTRIAPNNERGARAILQYVAKLAKETAEKHLPEYILKTFESVDATAILFPSAVGIEIYVLKRCAILSGSENASNVLDEYDEQQLFRVSVDCRAGMEIHAYDIQRAVKEKIAKLF